MKQTRQHRPAKQTHSHCEMTEVKGQLSQKKREAEEEGESETAKQREEEEEWRRGKRWRRERGNVEEKEGREEGGRE